jgi:hypothetical protein
MTIRREALRFTDLFVIVLSNSTAGGVDDRAISAGSDVCRAWVAKSMESGAVLAGKTAGADALFLDAGKVGFRYSGTPVRAGDTLGPSTEGCSAVGSDLATVGSVLPCGGGRGVACVGIEIVNTSVPAGPPV